MAFYDEQRPVDLDTYQDRQTLERTRLAGLDAPEAGTPEAARIAPHVQTLMAANAAGLGQRQGRDVVGRTVNTVVGTEGQDLNAEMVRQGYAQAVDYTGAGLKYGAEAHQRFDDVSPARNLARRDLALTGKRPSQSVLDAVKERPEPERGWLDRTVKEVSDSVDRGFATARAGYFGAQSAVGNLIARDPDGAGPKTDTLAEDPKTLSLRDRFSNWMQRTGERGYMRNMQQAEQNPKTMTFQQAAESGKLADYSSFAFEAMGEAIPSIIEMLGVGAATALTGGAAGAGLGAMATRGALGAGAKAVLERSAQRALVNTTRKKLIAQGVTPVQAQALSQGVVANLPKHLAQVSARRGFTAGMFGSSAGMQAGQFYKEAENETGVRAPGTALLAGGAAGALDVAGFEVLLGQLLNKRIPINKALDILKPVMAGVAVGVPGEGLTEAAQEVIGVLNTEYHRKSDIPLQERMLSKENLWRYAEAGAAGAVFGGAFGGAGGAARGTYDFATRERSPVEAPTTTPPTQETPPTTDTGTPDFTPPAETESTPDFTPPAETESTPDFTPPAEPESTPDLDPGARQTPGQDPVAAPVQTPTPAPPAAKPYALDDQATPDQQRGFLFDSEEAAAQTAKDLLGPLDIPVTPRQQHEVSIAEDDSVIPGLGAFGLATPTKSNDELTVDASEGVAQDVETVPARFLADMDQARTTLGGTSQLKTALTRASPNGWAKDEVVPKVLDTFETLSRALAYADDHSLKSGEYLIGRKNDGYAVVDLRAYLKTQPAPAPSAQPEAAKPSLPQTGNPHREKDQGKWEKANKFIGRGSKNSSTQKYANALGPLANSGQYEAADRVFVSAEGARTDRIEFDAAELQKALDAKATIITDDATNRARDYNRGERVVATYLEAHGYQETKPGEWTPAPAAKAPVAAPKEAKAPAKTEAAQSTPTAKPFEIVPVGQGEIRGMRGPKGETMATVKPEDYGKPNSGWLGNPHKAVDAGGTLSRKEAVAAFKKDFLAKVASDPAFRKAVLALRGQKVGYYKPNEADIHLTVVQDWLAAQTEAPSAAPSHDAGLSPKAESKRSAPTQGTTPEAFRQELSAKERKRLDAPNVHVLHRTTDAPFPVAPDTAGLYLPDGSVYFFTENIAPGEAFGKTVHELGAHYGLQRMVGKEVYDGILNQLQDMVKAEAGTFTSTKAAYARAKEAGASESALWHETLAYLAEASPRHGLIRRLVHAIKRFLRSLGIPVGRLTEQDLVSLVQVAAFKEGLKGEGLSTGRLASKRLPATPYVAQYGVKTLKNGKVAPAYGILYGDGRVLDTFDKKAEAEAALKADREGYAQEAARRVRDRPAERLAGMKASERGPQAVETRVYGSPEGRRTPDYNPKTNAGPTAVDDTPGFSTAKPLLVETPEWKGVRTLKLPSGLPPVTSLPQAEQAQRQAQAARAKADAQTTTQQRLTADLSPASPLSPKDTRALDVKPLTGKLGKLAAMMRGAKDRTRAISTSLALMLRSERKAPGVNVGALLELYRNALDTGRTEQAEPEEVAERQDATRKRLQKQRRAVALVTELRDAAQVVTAEEDQLAERIKDFYAAKQRATKDPAFIKELQQSAQEAEQRVNAAKARAEALKTEEAALLNALKKPVARSVRNLTKRQQEAVAGLARDYPDLTDRLRAVTAWVSPTDLPLIDHLAKAIEAIDDYRHRDTSTLYDLDDVLMAEADDHLAARQVEARVRGEPGEGWQEQSMNVEAPTEGFYTLFKGQYFTQALARVLSPLLKSTQRTEGELRQRWDQVTEALEGVGPIENTLFGLIEAANTMVPAQGTTLDAATRVVEMKLSDAEAWLNEDPDTTFGTLLLREVQTEDAKLANDAQYAQRNAHSNVGRFTRAMAGLRAWHDRYQVPYGQLYLQYDAKSQQFSITERMTSTNPNALEVFVDPHTGTATSLMEWVNDYLAQQAKGWKLPSKTGKETEFFRDNVLTLTPIDRITGKLTGKAQKADPLLKTDSQTGFIYVQGKSITQLGYALAQQQGLMTPENDYQAFMLARAVLLDHANLALNTPELMDKNIARSAKAKLTFAQALAQEQGAREGRLPKATDKLLEPNTLGVAPAPSVVEGEAAFKKSLNDMDLAKREVFDPVYQKVYDTQIAQGKTEALAKKIATGRANEALRKHLLEQKDKERASDAWEYEGQWDLDSGTAPLDVAEKKQLAAAEEDAGKNQRLSNVESRIGKTSTKATGNPQNLPVQVGGVFGQEGTEAHGLIQRALAALGFTKTRIHLYTSDQVEAYEAALKARNMTVWQGFTTRRERVKSIPAAVAFTQGEIFLYYDKSLTGETLREALSHELGHVVFRVMLNSERERNTPLWNRLFDEYQGADTGQRFMEWFADEAGRWINQRDQRVTNATQGFIKRIVDALKAMFRALGLRPAKGAVAAYMDGLALREKEQAYAEFQRALTGRIGQGYDLTTMQMAYHSRASERIHLRVSELDFITMDGVKRGTLAQAQRLLEAVPALQTAWAGAQTVGQWVTDTLSTANNFLREQNLAELTMHADVLDRGARQRVIEFTTNEQIDELLHDPEWSKLLGGVAEAKVKDLKARANALRKKDWVAGVVLIKYKDQRTGTLEAEIRPIPQESFNAAIHRLYQGQWGSSDEGYRKLLHGKTEAEVSEIGKELLRNDPKSETAKALAAWLKMFYKDYVVKGFTGAHSGTVHIGQQADWGLARYYSPKAVEANLQAFIDLLTTTRKDDQGEVTWRGMPEGEAREFASHIITGQEAITEKDLDEAAGLVRPTLSPGAPSKQGRHITLPIEELLPFLETNADAVIARYVHSMIKRVEWEKRFGDEVLMGKNWVWQSDLYGQLTQAALINNHRDTLSANRMKYLLEKTRAINEAYLGRYGAYTTDPRVRAGMSWVQALMNVLVMPLSLLSQAPDLAGPLTRMGGGTGAYAKGLRDAYRAMRDKDSDLWKVAEMYGIVYRDFRDSQAASFFDSQYLTTGPQKLNDWLFKWNGMQMFTNFSRLLSFHASGYWLEDLITGQHPDAERWLKDLGLTPSEVQQWVEGGKKEYTSADGEKSVAFKIMLARQRFVQESVFSPNAGQRPLFASHPYAMLVWHLKQFAFSFFTQILKPAAREVMKNPRLYGKMMAVLPLALMMPLAMLGMGLRDELKYGEWAPWRGERPSFDQDPEGWLSATGRVISRTGVLGPLQLLIDADRQQSWGRSMTFALAGPAASKLEELFLADDTGEFVMKALPGLSMLPAERAAFRSWVE